MPIKEEEEKLKQKSKQKLQIKKENKEIIKSRKKNGALKPVINMMSKADMAKAQGVLSVYEEQVKLVKEFLKDDYDVLINSSSKADIVHYHTFNPEFMASFPLKKAESFTVGYVHYLPETVEESIELPDFVREVFNYYTIQFYKMMDYLVVVNPYFIDLLEGYGVDREGVYYIPNFVSHEKFYPMTKDEIEKEREKLQIDKDAFVVLGVGQLQTRKGIFDFIEIAKQMPQITFVWAGGFSFSVISEGYKEIKKITENPPENVKFLGIVDREEMGAIYNMADVMFLPSYAELFPMSIVEAMSCHVPILIRDLDIYPAILFDFYLASNTNEGFIETINKLSSDREYYNLAKEKAKKGTEYYAREHIAEMWRDFYSMVLKEGENMRLIKKNKKKENQKDSL